MHGSPTYGKAFKATLRILFSAGNLLYVLVGSILLLLAMLPLLSPITHVWRPVLTGDSTIAQALTLLSVFILTGKTCDNMARIQAGLGDAPSPLPSPASSATKPPCSTLPALWPSLTSLTWPKPS